MLIRRFPLLLAIIALIWSAAARAEEKNGKAVKAKREPGPFVKILRDDNKEPLALQTSIVRYVPKTGGDGVTVDLISAVHIGEPSYYEALNKAFDDYDAVLYELVAPEGTRIPKGGGQPKSAVSALQLGMKNMLELEYQLAGIDYTKENLVHADMTPEQFEKSMADRGESFWTIMFRMMGTGMAMQTAKGGGASDFDLLKALFDRNRSLALKRVLAEQFEDMDVLNAAFGGPNGSTLITERNKAALQVLKKQIDGGEHKRIAIFYGAGHMPDIEERLAADFQLQRGEIRWLEAWNLRKADKPKAKPRLQNAAPAE